jgi:hypothetical protein
MNNYQGVILACTAVIWENVHLMGPEHQPYISYILY